MVKSLPASAGDAASISGSEGPLEKEVAPVSLPGKSHEQRSLAGYSPWVRRRVRHDLVTGQQQHLFLNTCQYAFFFFSNKASAIAGLPW